MKKFIPLYLLPLGKTYSVLIIITSSSFIVTYWLWFTVWMQAAYYKTRYNHTFPSKTKDSMFCKCILNKACSFAFFFFSCLRGGNSDTGFSSILILTYGEILLQVYSLHNSFISNLFLASECSVLTKRCLFFQIYFIQF